MVHDRRSLPNGNEGVREGWRGPAVMNLLLSLRAREMQDSCQGGARRRYGNVMRAPGGLATGAPPRSTRAGHSRFHAKPLLSPPRPIGCFLMWIGRCRPSPIALSLMGIVTLWGARAAGERRSGAPAGLRSSAKPVWFFHRAWRPLCFVRGAGIIAKSSLFSKRSTFILILLLIGEHFMGVASHGAKLWYNLKYFHVQPSGARQDHRGAGAGALPGAARAAFPGAARHHRAAADCGRADGADHRQRFSARRSCSSRSPPRCSWDGRAAQRVFHSCFFWRASALPWPPTRT